MGVSLNERIVRARPRKNQVDPWRPYAWMVERERSAAGALEDVATIFLTNRECPYRCTMCDLWKNTLDETVPRGAIPAQIRFALERLAPARHIKLYNSGNFFDRRAIPPADFPAIAGLVSSFETVIVENHPNLCGPPVLDFQQQINGQLEIAMGLETVHAEVLQKLNKQMTVADFRRAAGWLVDHGIAVRTFVLLRPPFMSESEGIEWAIRSVRAAADAGSRCVAVIPTRAGNGYLDQLARTGDFAPPSLRALETVMDRCLPLAGARLFADLWDLEQFSDCDACLDQRRQRLQEMNDHQRSLAPIQCERCSP